MQVVVQVVGYGKVTMNCIFIVFLIGARLNNLIPYNVTNLEMEMFMRN